MTGIESFNSNAAILTAAQTSQQLASQQMKKSGRTGRISFADTLRRTEEENQLIEEGFPPELAGMTDEEAVIFLKDEVDLAGDIIRFHQSFENIANYRNKVSQFLKFITKNNYEVIERRRLVRRSMRNSTNRGLNAVWQINVINEKLNNLMNDTIINHGRNLRLLARIGEINGLIIDLLQ